ncbi:MAG: VCBS repeat-containing protein [Cyclobacteriaceae bacterium]|nr:VCBS repeat-containing protein [Cyclobacteriaceae bacterium]
MKHFLILLFLSPFAALAQITSTFDTDADGWTFLNTSTSVSITHSPTNGNPGGYISATYSSNTSITTQHWFAPAKFLGNHLVLSLGMNFSFDLQQSQAGTVTSGYGDLRIESGGNVIIYTLPVKPAVAPAWSSYSVTLDETTDWRWSSPGGAVATRAQIKSVLANITNIKIRGTYATNAAYTCGLDNVILEQRTLTPAPVATSLSTTSGKPGDVITITGSGFSTAPSENSVWFGVYAGVKANVQSATATELIIEVPEGVVYGPITITNTITGLSTKTGTPFNPVFDGGGRIIPASFKNRFTIPTIPIEGWFVGDFDGDGWDDFAVTNNNAEDVIDIYRNLGLGGELSAASFAAKVTIPAPPLGGSGTNGAGLWFADLDGDGKPDAITSNALSPTSAAFITLRNTSTPGNISFEAPEYWTGGSDETPIALVADLDGDGRPEIMGGEGAVCGCVRTDFWFNQNLSTPGNIEFSSAIGIYNNSVISGFAGAAAGDLNGDGKVDLVVSSWFGDRFTVLQNTSTPGMPSFLNSFTISTGQYNRSMRVVDINLDGKNDLMWRKTGGGVYIRINTDTDGILTEADFATEYILTSDLGTNGGFSMVDFNGDGKPDIVSTDDADVGVYESVFTGGEFNTSAFVPAYQVLGTGGSSGGPAVTDLNHDGKPDLMMASGSSITIVENKNVVGPQISVNTVSPLAAPVGATVTITGNDFSPVNTDNHVYFGAVKATVLTASATAITVSVPPSAAYAPVSVRKGELTSRYRLPFVTTFSSGVTFDNTHFAPPVNFTLTNANYDIEVGDLNRDGKPDILVEGIGGFVFRNTHTTGAISTSSLLPNDTLSTSFINPRLEDFDGDGLPDAVSVNGIVHKNNSTSTEINFLAATTIGLGGSTLDLADFNNDGKTDIVITVDLSGAGDLVIRENRTANVSGNFVTGTYGSFSQNFVYNKPAANGGVVSEDFDGDGFADIATTNPLADNISVYRNVGLFKISTAQFASRLDIAVGDNPGRIYKGDFDSDGKVDLLLYYGTGTNPALLTVMHNTSTVGNISFNRIDLTNPSNTTVATIADLDGDGKPEIITTSESGNRFSIFKNIHSTGAFTAASFDAPFNTTVTAPRGLATGDLNLDGRPEIIITRAANLLVVYENLVPTTSISITQQPASPNYVCENASASFTTSASGTTNISYQWQKHNGSVFVDLVNNSTYTDVTTATLTVNNVSATEAGQYQCIISGDNAASVTTNVANLVFNSLPSPPDVTDASSCGPGSVTLTASGGDDGDYRWYSGSPATLIAGQQNDTYTTPVLSTSTTYYVSLTDTFCESVLVPVNANINAPPNAPVVSSTVMPVGNAITACSSTSLILSAPNGFAEYLWSDGSVTQQLTVTASGNYSVSVAYYPGCFSAYSDVLNVTIISAPCNNSAPVINTSTLSTTIGGTVTLDLLDIISDADNNIVLSSLTIIQQPQSGAQASLNGTTLLINYTGNPFTGIDVITIRVCDVFGECVTQQLQINVIGEIEIFNAVSPNNDGKNDFFIIQNIEALEPENTVTIYNRWGSKVFETDNYSETNAFRGLNQNGNELPSGTYFYKIFFKASGKTRNGFLVVKH